MIGKIKYIREGKSQMELNREEDARFLVHHQVTEKKLLHLEKGVRKLGFQSGGNRILAGAFDGFGHGNGRRPCF